MESVIRGENADTRLFRRGLLRLHRRPVGFGAATFEEVGRLPCSTDPGFLAMAVESEEGSWGWDLSAVLTTHPGDRS